VKLFPSDCYGENHTVGASDSNWPRLCEKTFRSPRRMANGRIRCEKSPEIASTWLKLTHENGALAFSHSLGRIRTHAGFHFGTQSRSTYHHLPAVQLLLNGCFRCSRVLLAADWRGLKIRVSVVRFRPWPPSNHKRTRRRTCWSRRSPTSLRWLPTHPPRSNVQLNGCNCGAFHVPSKAACLGQYSRKTVKNGPLGAGSQSDS